MCGILGAIGGSRIGVTAHALQRALNKMSHRGPDDEGYVFFAADTGRVNQAAGTDTDPSLSAHPFVGSVDGHFDVALAHRRLSVLDVSPAGHQPMATQDGRFWIVLNGEIYNFLELRQTLAAQGHVFITET